MHKQYQINGHKQNIAYTQKVIYLKIVDKKWKYCGIGQRGDS